MSEYRIVYRLTKYPYADPKKNPNIGFGIENGGLIYKIALEQVLDKLKHGLKFYVEINGLKAYVEEDINKTTGHHYIRTIPDYTPLDNLSNVPAQYCDWQGSDPYSANAGAGWDNPQNYVNLNFVAQGWQYIRRHTSFGYLDTHGEGPGCAYAVGYNNYDDTNSIGYGTK